jgi:hypothetical protein
MNHLRQFFNLLTVKIIPSHAIFESNTISGYRHAVLAAVRLSNSSAAAGSSELAVEGVEVGLGLEAQPPSAAVSGVEDTPLVSILRHQ